MSAAMTSNDKSTKIQPMMVLNPEDIEDSYLKAYREQHQYDNIKIIKPIRNSTKLKSTEITSSQKAQKTSKKQFTQNAQISQTTQTTTVSPSIQNISKLNVNGKKIILVNKVNRHEKDQADLNDQNFDQDLQTSEQIHYIVPKYYDIGQLLKSNDAVIQPLNYNYAQNILTLVPQNYNNHHQVQQLNDVLVKNPNIQMEQLGALLNAMKAAANAASNEKEYIPIEEDVVDIMNTASKPNVKVSAPGLDAVPVSKQINRQQYQRQLDNTDDQIRYAAKYAFGYHVHDHHSGNDFGHEEHRDGEIARGQYHVLLPDGRVQNVKYHAGPIKWISCSCFLPLTNHQSKCFS